MENHTKKFDIVPDPTDTKLIMQQVYAALQAKGYDPISQIVGYIVSDDPTYITNYNNARSLICHIDREELLEDLVKNFLGL